MCNQNSQIIILGYEFYIKSKLPYGGTISSNSENRVHTINHSQ